MNKRDRCEYDLIGAERKLFCLESLIDDGHLGPLVTWRLNSVCKKIKKLDTRLAALGGRRSEPLVYRREG